MVILAPEGGKRTTLSPDPIPTITTTSAYAAALTSPFIAGGAAAIGLASYLATKAAALAKLQQPSVQTVTKAVAGIVPVLGPVIPVIPKITVPPLPALGGVPLLPPLAPLPAPPSRPSPVVPAAGAAGGLMMALVVVGLLSGLRR